jgi:hypothetical protein
VGSIGNVHVNENEPIGSIQYGYNRADEELDDDDYMKLLMNMTRRMETCMATTTIATTVEKVVLVALQSVAILMQPPLAMGMVDLIMLPRSNQLRKLPMRE